MQSINFLNPEDQREVLNLVRTTLEKYLQGQSIKDIKSENPVLQKLTGAFVTLHKKGDLRGCIGHLISDVPLWQTIKQMAIAAAVEDTRFDPVTFEELSEIDIEISVLTPFKKIEDTDEIEVGKHGLLITQGRYRGLLLPQVATEYGWNREEFLGHTCIKAGLSPEAWMDPSTQIEIFSAQVFGEKSPPLISA